MSRAVPTPVSVPRHGRLSAMAPHPTSPFHPVTAVAAAVFDFDGTLVASRLADEAAVDALIRLGTVCRPWRGRLLEA